MSNNGTGKGMSSLEGIYSWNSVWCMQTKEREKNAISDKGRLFMIDFFVSISDWPKIYLLQIWFLKVFSD